MSEQQADEKVSLNLRVTRSPVFTCRQDPCAVSNCANFLLFNRIASFCVKVIKTHRIIEIFPDVFSDGTGHLVEKDPSDTQSAPQVTTDSLNKDFTPKGLVVFVARAERMRSIEQTQLRMYPSADQWTFLD